MQLLYDSLIFALPHWCCVIPLKTAEQKNAKHVSAASQIKFLLVRTLTRIYSEPFFFFYCFFSSGKQFAGIIWYVL